MAVRTALTVLDEATLEQEEETSDEDFPLLPRLILKRPIGANHVGITGERVKPRKPAAMSPALALHPVGVPSLWEGNLSMPEPAWARPARGHAGQDDHGLCVKDGARPANTIVRTRLLGTH